MPALRVLIPFILGILTNTWLPGYAPIALLTLGGLALLVTFYQRGRSPMRQYRFLRWWTLPLFMLSMSSGALTLELYRPRPLELERVNGKIAPFLIDHIDTYDFVMRLQGQLFNMGTQPERILLTTRGCDYSLHEGDVVALTVNLQPVTNLGNPDEFDRENHLWQQRIMYSQHLDVNSLQRLGHRKTLLSHASAMRRHLVAQVLNTSLSPRVQDLMIALLLGNNRQIDPDVRNHFSHAGIAHILALSGLHVGLITCIIWFLLFPLDYVRLKKLRLLITIAALTGFALVTGLSPSVVRASIMISFSLIAVVLFRRSVALNALAASALFTLCIWPTAIYQASFQLSYVTVGAIVGLQGLLPDIGRKKRMLHSIWSLLKTSLIALTSTIMLSAYYFCSVSVLSVLSNILILPIMPVLMVLGAVFLFLAVIGLEWSILNTCLETLYSYMHHVSQYITQIPGAHVGGIYVTGLSVCIFYTALAFLVMWRISRQGRWLVATLCATLTLTIQLSWLRLSSPSTGLTLLNDYHSTPIIWHENGQGYAWLPDETHTDVALFEQNHKRFLAHIGIDSLQWVSDCVRSDLSLVHSPFAMIQNQRILVAGKGMTHTRLEQMGDLGKIDLLVITKRFHGHLADLISHCHCSQVVLSGDLSEEQHSAHLTACRDLHLPYHDLRHGALSFRVDSKQGSKK